MNNCESKNDNSSTTSTVTAEEVTATPTPQTQGKVPSAIVTTLGPNDCLMGRGAAVIGNEGNRRFRKLIQKYKHEYDSTRIRQEKDRIARKIMETIISRQGRFLKKIDTPAQAEFFKVPSGKTAWVSVKEAVVLQKVKQAFRDDRRSFDEDRSSDPPSPQGIPRAIPSALKPDVGSALNIQKTHLTLDALLSGPARVGHGSSNPSLLLEQKLGGNSPVELLFQQQQLRAQLDSQSILTQVLASRKAQLEDPLTVLRLKAASEQAILEENRRVMLLRELLARQNASSAAPSSSFFYAAQPPAPTSSLVALNRQATLREQLAAMTAANPTSSSFLL